MLTIVSFVQTSLLLKESIVPQQTKIIGMDRSNLPPTKINKLIYMKGQVCKLQWCSGK